MNHFILTIFFRTVIIVAVVMLQACSVSYPRNTGHQTTEPGKPLVRAAGLEQNIHALINNERKKHDLPPLDWNPVLTGIARKHSHDMALRNYFAHTSPEGHDFLYRYKQAGYICTVKTGRTTYLGAENIALNNLYDSVTTVNGRAIYDWNSERRIAETTVKGWMESPGHRQNILTPHFISEGIGVVIAPDDRIYITQNFC